MDIYVIQPGDTLIFIAGRYAVSPDDILNLNALPDPEQLITGQSILIPGPPPEPLQYTMVIGDLLYRLADAFNTTVSAIIETNGIENPNSISAGTTITIPGWLQVRYTIRPDDTLYAIAGRLHTPLNLLIKVSQLSNPAFIFPGQILNIPLATPK